jgi:hypothetical protein
MIKHELHGHDGLLTVTVTGPLEATDFQELAAQVDPYLEEHETLKGLMIVSADTPDWADLSALVSHIRFVRNHHERIQRVALVSDSGAAAAFEKIAEHFVDADLESFPTDEREAARRWLLGND